MTSPLTLAWPRPARRGGPIAAGLLAGLLAALAVGCGVGTGGTGTFASGPISGFGSVIVGGVAYDETTARIEDEDGQPRPRSELRLGMTVEIDGETPVTDGSGTRSATAARVRVVSEVLGPVTLLDRAAGRLAVLGVPVRIAPSTVFAADLTGGLAALAAGDVLEVFGYFDVAGDGLSGAVTATRIERRSGVPAAYRLRGVVRALDTAAGWLQVGPQVFVVTGAAAQPASLVVGQFVALQVSTVPLPGPGPQRWRVEAFGPAERPVANVDAVQLEGLVDRLASATQFSVDGVAVDAATATVTGDRSQLQPGARVRIEGMAHGGRLVARTVEIRPDELVRAEGYELRGVIESVDRAAQSFQLRGLTVSFAEAPVFDQGSAADLAAGRAVRVRALLAPDRTRLVATRIEFPN